MIVPSIDLMQGQAVQLVGGKEKVLDAGDPLPIAENFKLAGEIAVVDLDAALGRGSNTAGMRKLAALTPCRVGGGIRSAEAALAWLDHGASKVVLGTAATPEVLKRLPPERVVVALDAYDGDVVVEGWTRKTGRGIIERMRELEGLAGGFLVTFVEKEGRLQGTAFEQVARLKEAAGRADLTIAGGISSTEEIASLDRLGADAQVGMALYTNRLSLAQAIAAPLKSDRADGLWATVICDPHGVALGLAWSDLESLDRAVRTRKGVYHSRSRGLWIKGETSGAGQELLKIDLDCDRDALRFTVRQHGSGFCHRGNWTCWGGDSGLPRLSRRLLQRAHQTLEGSYTQKLLDDPRLLRAKLVEEAAELADASTDEHVVAEAADVLYFTLCALARKGIELDQVSTELDKRSLKISRTGGSMKNSNESQK